MDNKRSTKNQPFCWQEKKILRLLRCQYEGKEHDKLRNLYLTLTEIYSDFNGKDIKYYTQTIIKYSSLSKDWIPKGLKIFENLKVIQLVEERNKGKFKGKRLIFTPENIEEMEKFTNEQKISDENTITDKTVTEFLEPSEDSLYLEDNKRIEDINNTHTGEDKKVHDKKQEEEFENGNFKGKANRAKNTYENKKEFERPAYENTTGDFIKDLLNGINGGK